MDSGTFDEHIVAGHGTSNHLSSFKYTLSGRVIQVKLQVYISCFLLLNFGKSTFPKVTDPNMPEDTFSPKAPLADFRYQVSAY